MILEFIITALAIFGICDLVVSFPGPKDIFVRLRSKFPESPLHCTVCIGTWVAIPFSLVFLLGFGLFLAPLAFIGIVIIFERMT